MKVLKDISAVSSGYPFRGKITVHSEGSVIAVQMKDVDMESGIDWSSTTRTNLPGRLPSVWLRDGNIAFVARGRKNYACVACDCPKQALLSPHFFQIRPDPDVILAEFLAWQLNQKSAQQYFARFSEGSAVVGIRKAVLESTPLQLPAIEEQRQIMKVVDCWKKQQGIIRKMAEKHEKFMDAIAGKVLNSTLSQGDKQ